MFSRQSAFHFAHNSRDAHTIAETVGVSVWTVRNWSQTPEWHAALDDFGYTGDRSFIKRKTRDTQRENGQGFENVKARYLRLLREGVPSCRLPALISQETSVSKRKVYEWAKRYGWGVGE